MTGNLFTIFHDGLRPAIDSLFIERADGVRLTFRDMVARTAQLANLFRAAGLRPGDRIAVSAEKSVEAVLVYLATIRAGCVHLPMNPGYTPDEIGYFLRDAAPAAFICRPDDEGTMRTLADSEGVQSLFTLGGQGDGTLLAAAAAQPESFDDVARSADDMAAILYTSGTTGRSKGAVLSHGNLRSNCEVLRDLWRFTPEDRLLHALPIFHTHGLFVAINTTLATGSSILFLDRFDTAEVVRLLPRATVMMGVPTFYSRLLDDPAFSAETASAVRLFISGSAPLSADVFRRFLERTGQRILERYGMTETNMITSNPYDGVRVPGSVGLPLPGVEVRIAAPAEEGSDRVGTIEVRGPNVFGGYWNMERKGSADFSADGFFSTGDLGHIDDKGYVYIAGRNKDLIISGGLNVYPAEVERVLDSIVGVEESAVIGVPHPDLGETVVAIVSLQASADLDEESIASEVGSRLARYKQPRKIVIVDQLPRNVMGKIQKDKLRNEYANILENKGSIVDHQQLKQRA